jgi:cyclopropane fatty-acyl-phospholipid synthase-like methyltransferase
MESNKLHSEHYFNDLRDFWWNADFMELMAKRLQLTHVHKVLDVGSGQGHWRRVLLPLFKHLVHLIGIVPEKQWVVAAEPNNVGSEINQKRFTFAKKNTKVTKIHSHLILGDMLDPFGRKYFETPIFQ